MKDLIVKIELPANEGSWGFVCASQAVLRVLNERAQYIDEAELGLAVRLSCADGRVRECLLPYDLVHSLFPFWSEPLIERQGAPQWVLNRGGFDLLADPHPTIQCGSLLAARIEFAGSYCDRDSIEELLRLRRFERKPHILQLDSWVKIGLFPRQYGPGCKGGTHSWYAPLEDCLPTIEKLRAKFPDEES